ncbi:MAG: DegT/DnrJ/EryC1/StrS family aminotransferase, partial [Lentisphaerota bacterium]
KIIVTNDQWGHPVDKDAILKICRKYELKYVEDCSHAHFSQYNGRYSGTFGDIACWSFQGNKLLSGGEGGILLTDNQDYYERAVLLGHNLKRPFESVKNEKYFGLRRTGFGLKLRIHPLAALIVLHQLDDYCFEWIRSRGETLTYFQSELEKHTPIQPMARRDYVTSMGAWYGFKPICDWNAIGIDRQDFIDTMQKEGVDADLPGSEPMINYELFHLENVSSLRHKKDTLSINDFPGAKKYYDSIISLPTFTFKDDKETIDEYVYKITQFFSRH